MMVYSTMKKPHKKKSQSKGDLKNGKVNRLQKPAFNKFGQHF